MSGPRRALLPLSPPRVDGWSGTVRNHPDLAPCPQPMPTSPPSFRALVVLADPVLASTLTSALAHHHIQVVGPFPTVDEALIALLHRTHLVAVLDFALPHAWALARTLEQWDVPYVALAAVDAATEEAPLAPIVALESPVAPHEVLTATLALVRAPVTGSVKVEH